jgi:guanine deaminase
VDVLADGALAVDEAGRIVAFGEADKVLAEVAEAEVVDLRPHLIIPGLVDTHAHLPQYDAVAMEGYELLPWLEKYIFPAEAGFADADHAREVARRFWEDMRANGTTTGVVYATVHQYAANIAFEEAERAGLRAVIGKVMMDRNAPPALLEETERSLRESEELCQTWHGRDGRLFYAFSPRFAPTCSPELMRAAGELARRCDAYLQTHLAENLDELAWVAALFPDVAHYTDVYDRAGLLGPRTLLAHAIYLREAEYELLAATNTRLCHCPRANFFLKSGIMDLARAVERGITVGLGTDVGAGPSLSLLHEMAAACFASKARYAGERFHTERLAALEPDFAALGEPGRSLFGRVMAALELGDTVTVVDPPRAFYLATLGGAEVLGLEGTIGSFAVGKEADFVALDPAALDPARCHEPNRAPPDLLSQLVYRGDRQAVRGVWVRGDVKRKT